MNIVRTAIVLTTTLAAAAVGISPAAAAVGVTCRGKPATLVVQGTTSGQEVVGTPGRDVVVVKSSVAKLSTVGGNDLICDPDAQAQIIEAGAGADHVIGGGFVYGGAGNDHIETVANAFGGLDAGDGNDLVAGDANGYASTQTIKTGAGNDIVRSAFTFRMDTGDGNDVVHELQGNETYLGAGNDVLYSRGPGGVIDGPGRDVVVGDGASTATYFDSAGSDVFWSTSHRNQINYLESGAARVDLPRQRSTVGSDVNILRGIRDVAGSYGNDKIIGDKYVNDIVDLAFGYDQTIPFEYDSGADVVRGGDGDDKVQLLGNGAGSRVWGEGGNDSVGVNGTADGGAGDDTLSGYDLDDVLLGGTGTDTANGRDGTDRCVAEHTTECEFTS